MKTIIIKRNFNVILKVFEDFELSNFDYLIASNSFEF